MKDLGKCEGCMYCQLVMTCLNVSGDIQLKHRCYNSRFSKKSDEDWERPIAGYPDAWSNCKGRREYG